MRKNRLEAYHSKRMARVNQRTIKNKHVSLINYWSSEIRTDTQTQPYSLVNLLLPETLVLLVPPPRELFQELLQENSSPRELFH